jgi:hypothetical protein
MPAANFPDDRDDLKRLQDDHRNNHIFRANNSANEEENTMSDETNPISDDSTSNVPKIDIEAIIASAKKQRDDARADAKTVLKNFVQNMKDAGATGEATISFNGCW